MKKLLLGCDLGEASTPDAAVIERSLWPMLDIGHVACGGHAGDDGSMLEAIGHARALGVRLSAHPSYPDRENFGRISMKIERQELRRAIVVQVERLIRLAGESGVEVRFLKPHGALYNDAHHDRAVAEAIVDAAESFDRKPAIVCAPTSQLCSEAMKRGVEVLREAFADRRYEDDGSLVSRARPGSLLLDVAEAAGQAVSIAQRGVAISASGKTVLIDCETLTIHSDMESSVERLGAIRRELVENGLQ